MNLLYCKNCGTIYSLRTSQYETCHCETTSGVIIEENGRERVEYTGDPFFLRIEDKDFSDALHTVMREGVAKSIELNILPTNHEDFTSQ